MKLSIIVPVFNEKKTILVMLKKLLGLKLPVAVEIVLIDDGSTDGTREIVSSFLKNQNTKKIMFINHAKNSGKGQAVRTGFKKSSGDFILIQDADLEYNPDEIINLIEKLRSIDKKNQKNTAIYGSRFLNKNAIIPKIYYFGNKTLTFITNLLYSVRLTDMETGYKLIPRSFLSANSLTSSRFDIEPEITAKLIKNKIKIIEVPITYRGRSRLAGKKITIRDAFGAINTLVYFRFFS